MFAYEALPIDIASQDTTFEIGISIAQIYTCFIHLPNFYGNGFMGIRLNLWEPDIAGPYISIGACIKIPEAII